MKYLRIKEKDSVLRNRMKLTKKKVDELFEILDKLLLEKFPNSKMRGYDFMLMEKSKRRNLIRYTFKNILTRDHLFMYNNTENNISIISKSDNLSLWTYEESIWRIQYKKLSKYHSNLGDKKYIELYCPRCYKSEIYGHLHWSAFKCGGCKGYINKTDYLIRK